MITRPRTGASARDPRDENVLYVKDLLGVLWRRWWIVILCAVVVTALILGIRALQTPTYEAVARVLVEQRLDANGTVDFEAQELNQFTSTMVQAINTRPVAEAVIEELDLDTDPEDFPDRLSARRVGDSQFIDIGYRDSDPEQAQLIANTIATVFPEIRSDISVSAGAVSITPWSEAEEPENPTSPNLRRDALLALALGGGLGLGLAFLLELLDRRWRSPQEVERVSGTPTFGAIPDFRGKGKIGLARFWPDKRATNDDLSRALVTVQDPGSAASEAYGALRDGLPYALVDTPTKVVAITSPDSAGDASVTCANLAVALSEAGKSTLAIDCQLREPALHDIFGLRNTAGVAEVLVKKRELSEVWQEPLPKLKVLTAGSETPDPGALLSSERFAGLVERAGREFDYVLINTPPVVPASDLAVSLAVRGDGVLLLIDSRNTRKVALRRAVRYLERAGARILGTVMDSVEVRKKAGRR